MNEVVGGKDIDVALQRPWRWWLQATREAQAHGDDVLVGRIFLFGYVFVNEVVQTMRAPDMLEVGLARPLDELYQQLAVVAVGSLARLPGNAFMVDGGPGSVDAGNALSAARKVADRAGTR
jgi:hypothetical protein